MSKKISCPECGQNQFYCDATIRATLTTTYDSVGDLDYELFEWEYVERIDSYNCKNCGFGFIGDEEELIEFLESESSATKD